MSAWPPLPIDRALPELLQRLGERNAAVLVAPPGAGKTTRVPLALLYAPWRADGRILVLEPRRLAARAAAEQMSRLLGEEPGGTVGYRVRLEQRVSARTRVEVVTEGVFTRLVVEDPSLPGVAAVLFDEFHERSLDGDFGLALALDAQRGLRDDLRLLVMSATLDPVRVAALLGDAPVVVSEGRSFPVETRYRPRPAGARVEDAVADAVIAALRDEEGSVLAFLPGAGEIERTAARLAERLAEPAVVIAPLHGTLDRAAQDRAIRPAAPGLRKVVLATAIAETSLTIEGVRVVVDGGLARVPRYEPAVGLTRLETVRVSRSSADQRRGRAGRTAPGVCIRLWEEGQTRALQPFPAPEIGEADLAPLLLDCAAAGVTDPAALAWLDPPPAPALAEAGALLRELEALDPAGRISAAGRALARLPLPPRLAHMLRRSAALGIGGLAAEVAVLIGERGLGGGDADLRHRIERFRADRTPRARAARSLAVRWARLVSAEPGDAGPDAAGKALALAFPDRIAKARDGQPGVFLLANGRGGTIDPADALAREGMLAVGEIGGAAARARIQLAAPLREAELAALFGERITEAVETAFDAEAAAARSRQRRRFGALVLAERPVPAEGEAATAALLAGLGALGLDALPWTKAVRQLLDRARFLARAEPERWPDLADAHLAGSLGGWLGPYVPGAAARSDIGPDALAAALDGLLGPLRREVDRLAPTHWEAPTGSRLPVDYADARGPTVAVRVQELFGLDRHPTVGAGMPLVLELLSPAQRPIQTTADLPGFWRGSWADVRADLRGRYPRHPWPENPLAEAPTRRAKPRGT